MPFATRTTSRSASKVYESKFISTYQILLHPDRSCCLDKVNRAAGRRAGALFFARRLDYFIMTRQLASIYRDLVLSRQITVTQNFSAIYRDWQKTRHRDTPPLSGQAHANSLNRRAVISQMSADRRQLSPDRLIEHFSQSLYSISLKNQSLR